MKIIDFVNSIRRDTQFKRFRYYLGIAFLLSVSLLILFTKLAEDLLYNELNQFDMFVINYINTYHTVQLTNIMKIITTLGSFLVIFPVTLIFVYYLYKKKRHFWDTYTLIISLGGGIMLNEILKWAFHRSRPNFARLVEAGGYSFPSGHSMMSFIFYGFISYLLWINLKGSPYRFIASFLLTVLIIFIGISRIYLGVHYPSDVIAGFAAGGFWLTGCIIALKLMRYYKANKE